MDSAKTAAAAERTPAWAGQRPVLHPAAGRPGSAGVRTGWDEGALLELRMACLPRDRRRPAVLDDVDLKIV